jgi:phosphate transport system substrate-binding protein
MTNIKRQQRAMRTLALAGLLSVVAMGCRATVEPPAPVRLQLAGSSSMQVVMEQLADAYTARYDWVSVDIDPRGSQLGLQALREGSIDIALLSRELSPADDRGVVGTVIAYDALAIVVNDQNPVDELTTEQLRAVFSGKILTWSEVGGDEADIQVISREDGSGTRTSFETLVMGEEEVTTMAVVVPNNDAVGTFAEEEPFSVGYASAVGLPLGTRALHIDGVRPSLQAVAQGDYPLIRPFVLVSRRNGEKEVRSFLDFVLGPAGQALVGQRYGRVR